MECSFGHPLSDEQLEAAQDNHATPEIRQHLQSCPDCTARLHTAVQFEDVLYHRLYRFDCPSPQQLGEYHLEMLPESSQRSFQQHLEQCILCTKELEALRAFMAQESVVSQPSKRVSSAPRRSSLREVVARLLPSSPQLALRGGLAGPFMADVDGATFIIDVQRETSGELGLIGQIVADDIEQWNGALVEIVQDAMIRGFARVGDLGEWSYTPVDVGSATVRIAREHLPRVVIPDIAISETGL